MFLVIASLLFVFINLYIYKSLKQRFSSYKHARIMKFIFLLFAVFFLAIEIAYFISMKVEILHGYLYKISVFAVGISFCLFLVCLVYDLLEVLIQTKKFSLKRRQFLKISIDISFIIISISYLFRGIYNCAKLPRIKEVEIKLKNLGEDTNLAVISDIHLGEYLNKDFLKQLVERINTTDHDAVLIVGDLLDIAPQEIGDTLEPLLDFKKPTFFVTGNHEFYHGAFEIIEAVKNVGVKVLNNENIRLKGINLVGVNDRVGMKFGYLQPNLQEALIGKDNDVATILMAHQPKYINENVTNEVDLCICGHTHAGQIFPFSFLVLLDQKYLHGLYNDGMKQIYVTSGAGFWGPPMRILAPAEIALLKLRKG